MESVAGVAAGAFVLALLENVVGVYTSIPTSFQDALSFTLLVVALVVFPQGLLGAIQPALHAAQETHLTAPRSLLRVVGSAALALALLLSCPLVFDRGTLNDIWNLAFAVVLASSWNMLGGFAGQVSIGYSAFIGIGAYTTALLALRGVDPYVTLPLAARCGAALFSLIGDCRRFACAARTSRSRPSASRRPCASSRRECPSPAARPACGCRPDRSISRATTWRWFSSPWSSWRCRPSIRGSPLGRALSAIRQDIDAAEALGVDSTKYKLAIHALSAALVAVAGGLFAINFQYISPGSVFDFRLSLTIVLMPIVGGLGTVAGPVLGAVLFGYLQIKMLSMPGPCATPTSSCTAAC